MLLQTKRILVTGAGGFLGGHIVDLLRQRECEHIIAPSRAEYDLTCADDVQRLFERHKPEVMIHAAAAVGGIGANLRNPGHFFYANTMMGIQVIEAARRFGTEKVVVVGTICSYPKLTPLPFREEDLWNGYPEEITAPYGIAKKAILTQCQTYREQYGLNAVFLMPVNLYGPRDNFDPENSHVIPAIIRKHVEAKARGDREVVIWGDGSATREFLYVEDAAEAIVRATESYHKPEPVNLGTGIEISIRELAELTRQLVGYQGSLRWDTNRPGGQPRRCLDISRAEREFGFRARTPLLDGLRKTVEWYDANRCRSRSFEA